MKKAILLILFLMLLTLSVFAEDSVRIAINGEEIQFEQSLFRDSEGHLYVPIEEFSEKTRIQYKELPNRWIVLFRDNVFIKFQVHSNTLKINGKEFRWNRQPFYREDVLYLPMDQILHYMSFEYDDNKEQNTLYLSTGSKTEFLQDTPITTKRIDDFVANITFDVPFFWDVQPNGSYGVDNGPSHSYFTVRSLPLSPDLSLREIGEAQLENNKDLIQHSNSLRHKTLYTDHFEILRFFYQDVEAPGKENLPEKVAGYQCFGYFKVADQVFEYHFRTNINDEKYFFNQEESIALSLRSKSYNIDTHDEHYVEYDNFDNFNTYLFAPVFSNMTVRGNLFFSGTISRDIRYLNVSVQRKNRRFEYVMPVREGIFRDNIPIPYGLGLHRVSVSLPLDVIGKEDSLHLSSGSSMLMQFSVLNMESNLGLYISPSKYVLSRDPRVVDLMTEVSIGATNYDQAKKSFEFMRNFLFRAGQSSMSELLDQKEGDSQALSTAFTAFLRYFRIPARVLRSDSEHYYVEFLSNGKWYFNDPTAFVQGSLGLTESFAIARPGNLTLQNLDY